MIDAFIRSMLGTWGNSVLDFFVQNNLWISALILFYGVCVFLGRRSYQCSASFLIDWFQEEYSNSARLKVEVTLLN